MAAPGERLAQVARCDLDPAPQGEGREDKRQLHHGGGRGAGGFGQGRVGHPERDLHRQAGRAGRAKNQPHVDRGHGIAQHRQDGQAQRAVQGGHSDKAEAGDVAVAHRAGQVHAAGDIGLRQDGQHDQHEEGQLLQDQAEGQGQAERVVQDHEVGRLGPAGGPG